MASESTSPTMTSEPQEPVNTESISRPGAGWSKGKGKSTTLTKVIRMCRLAH